MIDLAKPALYADGITVFRDHADPARFHYLPDAPRLRRRADGSLDLDLLKYQLDSTAERVLGAGLLSFTVDLAVEEERLKRLRGRLSSGGAGAVQLTPVVVEDGACELMVMGTASEPDPAAPPPAAPAAAAGTDVGTLVAKILGAGRPSLFGDNACTFMIVLSPEGAALAEGALRGGGGLPAGVVYTLKATGIRPALRARITARWTDIYTFYENRLHGGKLLLAADIGATISTLKDQEFLSVEIDQLVPADEQPQAYQQAIDQVQRYILDELFKPTLGVSPPPEDPGGTGALATIGRAIMDIAGFFSFTYSLREVDRHELKTLTYDLHVADAERLTLSPQGTLHAAAGEDIDLTRVIRTVTPAAAAEMRFDIAPSVDLQNDDIEHIEFFLHYGSTEEHLLLDSQTPRTQQSLWYHPELGTEVGYRYEVHFGTAIPGSADIVRSAEQTTSARVIRLNPRELYQLVTVRVVPIGVPFDRYPLAIVDLKATDLATGWSTTTTLQIDATHPESIFRMRASIDRLPRIERQIRYVDTGGVTTTLAWDTVPAGVLVVPNPLPDVITLQILASARFGTAVRRLIVELREVDDPASVASFILTADRPSDTWSRAVRDGASRDYEYRVTVHTVNSEVREGQWLVGPPGKLIVGEGFARLRQVDLMLIGPSLQALGLLGVKVRFQFDDSAAGLFAEDEILVQDLRTPVHWSYPVADPSRQTYTYQLTLIRSDGTQSAQPPVTTADLLAIQSLQ
jgi:hypothetical protein